jgi:hypothetical protein
MFEITWYSEDSDTMSARVDSLEALNTLRNLISADSNLTVSSVTESDSYGVIKVRSPQPAYRPREIDIPVSAAAAKPRMCAVGVGPSLCSRFPQCGCRTAPKIPVGTAVNWALKSLVR